MRTIDEIALSRNPRGEIVVDDGYALMSQETFDELLVYDATLPTGKTPGKRWSRTERPWARVDGKVVEFPPRVLMGEYMEHPTDDSKVLIVFRKVLIA